jgi:voltage-gated potassium channel
VPQTALGKVFAGIFALTGIGIVAIPTGILAAAFSEAFSAERSAPRSVSRTSGARPSNEAGDPAPQEKP